MNKLIKEKRTHAFLDEMKSVVWYFKRWMKKSLTPKHWKKGQVSYYGYDQLLEQPSPWSPRFYLDEPSSSATGLLKLPPALVGR